MWPITEMGRLLWQPGHAALSVFVETFYSTYANTLDMWLGKY